METNWCLHKHLGIVSTVARGHQPIHWHPQDIGSAYYHSRVAHEHQTQSYTGTYLYRCVYQIPITAGTGESRNAKKRGKQVEIIKPTANFCENADFPPIELISIPRESREKKPEVSFQLSL